ncbi:5-formyltetrahydrofolate cyclo-ligase [Clostridium pasteurianum]|uniref:5-formyltetrahydrofolate cyclo-ligase n=1 Tax=Clostridium pasteurianum TaxID=1501 RepID=UPI00241C7697|nr:5-formyltetrahydrofolate cyclo-ligase [Clostridium pasteurianum]
MKTSNAKSDFRECIAKRREELSLSDKKEKDSAIYEIITKSKEFIEAEVLFIYVSFGKEVDTHNIIKYALNLGKKVCAPRVISRLSGMKALKVNDLEELELSSYGILEPKDTAEEVKLDDMDLAIIPGLAFDLKGDRIGYGGGFYDRFFSNKNSRVKKWL